MGGHMGGGGTYGIVFSGAGALGAWEVGCYDAIRKQHDDTLPVVVTGASAGAINATGVCAGLSAAELTALWTEITWQDFYRPRFSKWRVLWVFIWSALKGALRALFKGEIRLAALIEAMQRASLEGLREFLSHYESLLDNKPFEDRLREKVSPHYESFRASPTRFAVSVTDLVNGKRRYFYKGPRNDPLQEQVKEVKAWVPAKDLQWSLAEWTSVDTKEELLDAMVGSAAVPILFPPKRGYFDGGVLLNQPIEAAVLLSNPDLKVLYVVLPFPKAPEKSDDVIKVASSVLNTWLSRSLLIQLDLLKLMKSSKVLPIPAICVIRPSEDLTEKLKVGILDFGKSVAELVQDGSESAVKKLALFKADDDATWYDL